MGGCVSRAMMAKSSWDMPVHEGIKSYHDRPRPLVCELAEADAENSGTYSLAHKDAAAMKKDQEETYRNGTMLSRFKATCEQYADRAAMGVRPLVKVEKTTIKVNGKDKPWEYCHFGKTQTIKYAQVWEKIATFGRGLMEIGVTSKAMVGMYEETRMEWIVSCYGIWCAGAIGVTVYANLGEDALVYAMKEAELSYMFCNGKLVKNLIKLCKAANVPIPTLIYTDSLPADLDLAGVTAYSFDDIIAKGATSEKVLVDSHDADDIALIMYTSGTTGDPKGVIMSQGNLISAVTVLGKRLDMFFDTTQHLSYVAYLPLAHILEFAAENLFFLKGFYVGYGSPRTLTDSTAKPHGDLFEYKPHLLIAVPRVFETIRKGVEAAIPPGLKKRIYEDAYNNKLNAIMNAKDTPYLNEKVFKNIRDKLGGRLIAALSGGAPLSGQVQQFLNVVTGATVIQGYGLTETCACTTTQLPWDLSTDVAGTLLDAVEVKLRDAEEWKHTDKPWPRGEILVRGPTVTKGYYKQPEMTREAFSEDGWFATGDVGAFDQDGNLRIIGRVKALVKNAFGEYVALDALEAVYCLNPIALPNGVCVLVNGTKSFICALVVTDEAKAMKFAAENGIAGTWPSILESPEYQKKATASFALTAKENKRKPFEAVKKVRVLADEWTPDNGILTAAQKLKRREIDKRYAALIAELFATEPDA